MLTEIIILHKYLFVLSHTAYLEENLTASSIITETLKNFFFWAVFSPYCISHWECRIVLNPKNFSFFETCISILLSIILENIIENSRSVCVYSN